MRWRILAVSVLAALVVGAWVRFPSDADTRSADVDWPQWGNTAANTHFADLAQIDRTDVSRLRLAWSRPAGPGQFAWETFPIVVGRTMYYDTGTDEVFAVDAATGKIRWSYTPQVNFLAGPGISAAEPVSRGVAYGAGKVYVTTADDRLIALDARTGRPVWKTRVADPAKGNTLNSPGAFWHDELIVGGPAGDAGLRGFVAAFDARTGRLLWRTYMTPGAEPGRGNVTYAGADVWMPPVVDPGSGIAYVSTGNPTPGFSAAGRPGCDPDADATVALDARTGKVRWTHTEVCGDSWDYDTTQAPTIVAVRRGGGEVRAIGAASKSGYYSTLDAETGDLISRSPYITRYSLPHREPTVAGSIVCPGDFGGIEYGPAAWSPDRRSLYLAGNQICQRYRLAPRRGGDDRPFGRNDLGGTVEGVGPATGVIVSLDPADGRIEWRTNLPRPSNGGVLSTAGGLVMVGDDDGYLYALDDRSGRVLWRYDLRRRVGSAPIAYRIDGVEYVAIAAGGSLVTARGDAPDRPARLFVFRLKSASG